MPSPTRRSTRAPLTRRRILEAALALIDERGLDELTMRALGAQLGVEAMSIYKHVPGKGAVLDGVVELLLEDLDTDMRPTADWREHLAMSARRFRALSQRHPAAFPLLRRRAVSAYVVGRSTVESGIALMMDAGVARPDAVRAMRSVVRYVLGFALSDPRSSVSEGDPALGTPAPLEVEFPLVADLVGSMDSDTGEGELFEFGLAAMIGGLEARLPPGASGAEGR